MGSFVQFKCNYCKYEEADLGVGNGRDPVRFLALFNCDNCKSVGSTWVHENQIPRCSLCYHDAITLFPSDIKKISCPKCGEPASFSPKEGGWE